MKETTFHKGQQVTVYQDPMTEQIEEGRAELISFNNSFYGIERWTVRFVGEQRHVERAINTTGKNAQKEAA